VSEPAGTGARLGLRGPNLLIAGVGKAGTTSLFHYLSQHPDVCASSVKEPRYFRLDDPSADPPPLEPYLQLFERCAERRYRMEASPQYFKGGQRTIELIRQTLERPRVIVLFRDPVTRLWSEYRFRKSRLTLPQDVTFDRFVERCERVRDSGEARTPDNAPYYQLAGGAYADHLGPWLEAFGDDLATWFFEDLVEDPPRFVRSACEWLGLDPAAAEGIDYSIENRTVPIRSRALQRLALRINREGGPLRNRRTAKAPLRRLYYALNRSSGGDRMSPQTRARLERSFAASNAALAELLSEHGRPVSVPWLTR
jgi:Sulfotransferase domain